MNRLIYLVAFFSIFTFLASFQQKEPSSAYIDEYRRKLELFKGQQQLLLETIENADLTDPNGLEEIKLEIKNSRTALKAIDFWLRYLEPVSYKQINGPLPVEWETEVFEKFEAPYKRNGAGLSLAALYLEESKISKDSLMRLIQLSSNATEVFVADSVTNRLTTYHNFFFCNRLFLLNLAAIYTTGFECPDPDSIVPELKVLMTSVEEIYRAYNKSFPEQRIDPRYLDLFQESLAYIQHQASDRDKFDHFEFIQRYVNPLFSLNQEMIRSYKAVSGSYNDYSLSNTSTSIFDKAFFFGQNPKGVYYAVQDQKILDEIKETGRLLFYDPLLSGNVKRSCASCHKPAEYFADTNAVTSVQFNERDRLARNTPTLINVIYNHLVNQDGKHFNLQNQAEDVVTNSQEMGATKEAVVRRVLSCPTYKNALKKYTAFTPYSKKVGLEHITSALTLYYSDFSSYYSPFDEAMNLHGSVKAEVRNGFNLFMGKAGCGTCHFVPHFNGVKPPYSGSEFEVLGTPAAPDFKAVTGDPGRFQVYPVEEMQGAFRTGTIRNTARTKPYMHNGIFKTLEEVIDFYDAGGGAGKGLLVKNQTLAADSLKLTPAEKRALVAFINSLNENIPLPKAPDQLPPSSEKTFNTRKVGGEY